MKILLAGLMLLGLALPAHADLKGNSTSWEVEISVDDFTDQTTTSAVILAEGGGGFILLGCYSSGFRGSLSTGKFIGNNNISDNVKYRIDKNEPVTTTMKSALGPTVYFNNKDSTFLKALAGGSDSVLVQLTSYNFETSRAKFSLKGAKKAIERVLQVCSGK